MPFNYQTKIIKIGLTAVSTLVFSSFAHAALPGFYLGIQGGVADTHYSTGSVSGVTSANIHNTVAAGRVFGGYEFTPNWAAELGYTQFANTTYKNINGTGSNGHISQNAVDLVGKGILPLDDGFGLYAKLGLAVINSIQRLVVSSNTRSNVYPTFGLGASYDITENIPIDISWNRIQKTGNGIPSTDFFAAGIAYNFG